MSKTLLTLSTLALGLTTLVAVPAAGVAAGPLQECTTIGTNTFDIDSTAGTDTFVGQGFTADIFWEITVDGTVDIIGEVTSGAGIQVSRLGYTATVENGELLSSAFFFVDVPPATEASHTFAPAAGQVGVLSLELGFSDCSVPEVVPTTTVAGSGGGSLPSTGSGNETALIAVALLGLGGALTLLVRRPRTQA